MKFAFTEHALRRLAKRALLTKPNGNFDLSLSHEIFNKEIQNHSLINNLKRSKWSEETKSRRNFYISHVMTPRYEFDIVLGFNAAKEGLVGNIITAYNIGIHNDRTGTYEQVENLTDKDALKEVGEIDG